MTSPLTIKTEYQILEQILQDRPEFILLKITNVIDNESCTLSNQLDPKNIVWLFFWNKILFSITVTQDSPTLNHISKILFSYLTKTSFPYHQYHQEPARKSTVRPATSYILLLYKHKQSIPSDECWQYHRQKVGFVTIHLNVILQDLYFPIYVTI